MKYVQLVERKKGRIKKNEQYTLDKFVNLMFPKGLFKKWGRLQLKKQISDLIDKDE